jgi:hypothetical protein
MVRPSGKASGREQMLVTEDAVDDTFHKRYDSYVQDDDINKEIMEGRDDAPARYQISGAASVYSLQSCPARAESALISSKKSKTASSVTSRQSRAVTIKVDNRACNSGIQQEWNELDDDSSSAAAASRHQDVTHILSGLSSLTSDCSSAVASSKSPKSIRSVFSKRSHSSVHSAASGSSRRPYPTTKSTPSLTSRQSTSSSAAASRQHDATSIRSGSASPTSDCSSEVACAKSRKSTPSASSKKSHILPSAASVSSRRSYSTTKSTPSATSRQSTALAVNELGDSSSAAVSHQHDGSTSIRSESTSPAKDCSSEVASVKSRKSMQSIFSKRSRSSVPSTASVSNREAFPDTQSCSGFFVSEGVSDCSSEEGEIILPSVSSRQSTAVAANELAGSSSAVASRQHDATSIRSGSASPTPDCSLQEASTSAKSHICIPSVVSTGSRSRKSKASNKSSINSKFEMKLPDVIAEEGDNEDNDNKDIATHHAASVSSRRSCPTAKSTPSSRQSRVIAAAEDSRACSSGLKQDWHELVDSSPAAASRKQAEETCIISGLSSLTSDCSLEEASTSAKSRKSMRSFFSKGSRSRKSKSSKKSSIKSKLETKVTPTIIAEEEENDDDIVDIVTHRSSNHSAKKEPSSTSSNHQVLKQHDLEFWSALAIRVAMAVMRAKGTEKMAQKVSMIVHQEGQRRGDREHSREMMSLLSAKLSMAILEAGGDGSVASAVMIAVMMASDNNKDVISMLSDNNSTDPSVVPSVTSTVESDRLKPTERGSITTGSPKGSTKGSTTTKSNKKKKKKKTSQANQSPKEANQSSSREETVSASLSVGSSTSALKRSQLESIQKEMDEKKRQLESLEMEVENAKKRATEEAERLLKTEMDSSIQPDRSKLDYILKEREQKQQQLQITRNEIEAKKRAAKEAMRLEYMLMEFEKRKKALEEEEFRNCLKRAENVLHQELAKINSDLGKVGERDADKTNPFMELIWNPCGIVFSGDPGDPCGTIQGEESLYTDDWSIPSMSVEHQPFL